MILKYRKKSSSWHISIKWFVNPVQGKANPPPSSKLNTKKIHFLFWILESDGINVRGFNPLTPTVKLWVIQSFLTFDSMDNWKAVEQYFTVELFVNPMTPRVKTLGDTKFLTFDPMDRTLKCGHLLECCCAVLYCGPVCFYILPSL